MLFAIDGNNWTCAMWHALQGNEDRVLSLWRSRIELIGTTWPAVSRIAVAFDRGPTFRHELDSHYKANREPNEAREAVLHAVESELRNDDRVVVLAEDRYEADDCLATAARVAYECGHRCVLASSDKDLRQCLRDGWVSVLWRWKSSQGRVGAEFLSAGGLLDREGLRPEQWPDYQILVGESGDNIAGCDGIGPVTARRLLVEHDRVDVLLKEPFSLDISQKQSESLLALRGRLEVARRLVTLCCHVPWIGESLDLEILL